MLSTENSVMDGRIGLLEPQVVALDDGRPEKNCLSIESGSVLAEDSDGFLEQALMYGGGISGPLTRREAEILQFIVSGRSNKEIAKSLCRSERTIEYHRNRLMRKVGVHNTAGLVARAISLGIV
jgi:DNA-binding NarL/FixJ family response regulator